MAIVLKNYSGFRKIAEGGMSEIFRAVERSTRRSVVIKKLHLDPSGRAFTFERCENEARNASALAHTNVISIIDYGEENGSFYIVMEHIDGRDLESLLNSGSFNRDIGLMIVSAALRALKHAHKKGVVHCDVKPANILIDRNGRVVLTDFGLSHVRAHVLSSDGGPRDFATPLYMPPEQAKLVAEQIGLASDSWAETASIVYTDMSPDQAHALRERGIQWDLWSVGVLLYRICTGTYPFTGNDLPGLLTSIVHSNPAGVRTLAGDIPPGIATVIERCLEKEPYRRPHSLDPVLDALNKHFAAMDVTDTARMITAHMADAMTPGRDRAAAQMGSSALVTVFRAMLHRTAATAGRSITNIVGDARSRGWLPVIFNPRSRFAKPIYAAAGIILLVLFGTLFIRERAVKTGSQPTEPQAVVESQGDLVASAQREPRHSRTPRVAAPVSKTMQTETASTVASAKRLSERAATPAAAPNAGLRSVPANAVPPGRAVKPAPSKLAVPEQGILKITADPPDARVFLDGTMLTKKEMASGKRVVAGFHDIVAQAQGYEPYQRPVLMEKNKTQMLGIILTKKEKGNGRLHVYSYPWSDLYIDGAFVGTTPTPAPITMVEGDHTIMLKREGYRSYQEAVSVRKDEVTRIQVELERE